MSSGCINFFVQRSISGVNLHFPETPQSVRGVMRKPACLQGPSLGPSCLAQASDPTLLPSQREPASGMCEALGSGDLFSASLLWTLQAS